MAGLAGRQGQDGRAARLWGAAEALREAIGTPLSPHEREEYALTPLGETLWEPLHQLCLWAERHYDEVLQCRRNAEMRSGREGVRDTHE